MSKDEAPARQHTGRIKDARGRGSFAVLDATRTLRCSSCLACSVVGLLVASSGGAARGTDGDFHQLVRYVEAASVGHGDGDRAFIRVGDHVFFDESRAGPQLAGLYLVAIDQSRVLHQFHYNTLTAPGASEGLARDIEDLPSGTLVVVVAMAERSSTITPSCVSWQNPSFALLQ